MKRKLTLVILACLMLCCTAFVACNTGVHTHKLEKVDAKTATCTEAGNSEYYYCAGCKKYFKDQKYTEITQAETVIAALGHEEVPHDGKAATCTEKGYEAYVTCSRCDYTTYKEIEIDENAHDLEQVGAQAPSYESVGWAAYEYCKREDCKYSTYEEIAKWAYVSEIKISAENPLFVGNMLVGEEATLTASVLPETAHNKAFVWSSSDETVVTVDENGKIVAVKVGTATVKATAQDGSEVVGEYVVTVSAKKSVFDGTNAVLVGCAYNTGEGCIGGIGKGSTIKFRINSQTAQTVNLQLEVVVNSIPHASYKEHFASITVGGTTVAPEDDFIPSSTEYSWTNHGVIAINGVSLIAGENEIIITASEGPSTNVFSLTLYGAEEFTEILPETPITEGNETTWYGKDAELAGGITVGTDGTLGNINCNNYAVVTYKVNSDKDVKAGLYLSLAFGSQTVSNIFTLTVNDMAVDIPSSFTATGNANWVTYEEYWLANVDLVQGENVIVLKVTGGCGNYDYMKLISDANITAVASEILVESVKVTTKLELLKVGGTVELTSSVYPSNATNKTLTWSSSNSSVATVDENGKVTAVGEGYADITAIAKSGKSCSIRIFVSDSEGTRYEAENATLDGCGVESANGNYVGGWGAGKTATFTVDGGEGGKVFLRIYTSVVHDDKTDDINKYFTVKLNGADVDLSQGTFAYNGEDKGWTTNTGFFTVEITLTAGDNTIKLCGVNGMATCLDCIAIIK